MAASDIPASRTTLRHSQTLQAVATVRPPGAEGRSWRLPKPIPLALDDSYATLIFFLAWEKPRDPP